MRHHGRFEGVLDLLKLNAVNQDNRGEFMEIIPIKSRPDIFPNGIQQVSQSHSRENVVRGIHWQVGMAKVFTVLSGAINLIMVDLRRNSPTFGDWSMEWINTNISWGVPLLYIPSGIGIGFRVFYEVGARVQYFHSTRYDPSLSFTLAWNDPTVDIDWNITDPVLSEKDAHHGMSLEDWQHNFESTLPEAQLTDRPLIG